MPAIIVHGGAGRFAPGSIEQARLGCRAAAEAGLAVLRAGGSALDAAELAVIALENDSTFNSGTGSHANETGEIEMDAILVDGTSLRFGAVAGIRKVRNPISVARRVMDETPHCMLAAEGATRFAHEAGFEAVTAESLQGGGGSGPEHGTVGAVAVDDGGRIAAATSTGGTRNKMAGRVGDSPLIGCGALAEDSRGGASATGHGESLMRVMMARMTVDFVGEGMAAMKAARSAVAELDRRVGGQGGVICVDPVGRVGYAFNTTHMAVGYAEGEDEVRTSI